MDSGEIEAIEKWAKSAGSGDHYDSRWEFRYEQDVPRLLVERGTLRARLAEAERERDKIDMDAQDMAHLLADAESIIAAAVKLFDDLDWEDGQPDDIDAFQEQARAYLAARANAEHAQPSREGE